MASAGHRPSYSCFELSITTSIIKFDPTPQFFFSLHVFFYADSEFLCVCLNVGPKLPKMGQEGFREVHTGGGFVLTKYEPVNSHGVPVRDHSCSKWDDCLM